MFESCLRNYKRSQCPTDTAAFRFFMRSFAANSMTHIDGHFPFFVRKSPRARTYIQYKEEISSSQMAYIWHHIAKKESCQNQS